MCQEVLLGLTAVLAAVAHGRKRQEQERQGHQDKATMAEREQAQPLIMEAVVAEVQAASALMARQQLVAQAAQAQLIP